MTVECKNGDTYRGFLDETEDNMNCILRRAARRLAARPSPVTWMKRCLTVCAFLSGFLGGLAIPPRARHPSAEDSRPRRVSGKC